MTSYQNIPTTDEESNKPLTVGPKSDEDLVTEINIDTFKVIALIIILSLIFGPIFIMFTNNGFTPTKRKYDNTNNLYVLAYSWQPEFCDDRDYTG